MRNLSFKGLKVDKRYLIAVLIAILCSIISGIVLYNLANMSIYFWDYAENYVCMIFNFKNGSLIFPHLLGELFYIYLFFVIGYFTRLKYLTLIPVFIRVTFFVIYIAVLIELNVLGGITVAIIVYVPISVISIIFCCITTETCRIINKKAVFFFPAILAVSNTLIFLFLINVVFRIIIVIV